MKAQRISLGLSTFVLASPFSDRDLGALTAVRSMGYDLVEVCIEDGAPLSAGKVATAARGEGLGVRVCGVLGPATDVSHEDPARRQAGADYLRRCVDFAAEVGSPLVSGPVYAAAGQARLLEPGARAEQWGRARDSLRQAAEHAARYEVALALEPLNRFESDLVNTAEQALRLCDEIGMPNVGLLLDTFHAHIEEKSTPAAILRAGSRLLHVQASENDRGAPGSGQVDWSGILRALQQVGYRGSVVVESFLPTVPRLAAAAALWRPVALSMEALARESIAFLRPALAEVA
jgi:D-psicose/D-tagatose/L-ribulose 3-epimerase